MSNLVVVGFKKDLFRASQVLNQLAELNDAWTVDLHDAVAVYRDYNGQLRVDQSYMPTTGEGAGLGALWGSLIGLTLAIPFTAGATAPAAAVLAAGALGGGTLGAIGGSLDAEWWKDSFGISDQFVAEVGAMVQPGDSAIFTLVRTADPDYVAAVFRGYGGTVLSSSLTREQTNKVQAVLDGKA